MTPLAAFRLGLDHGIFCVGCCWAIMLLMFVVGAGSIAWMLLLGVAMALEKNAPWGRRLIKPLGIGLLASSGIVVAEKCLALATLNFRLFELWRARQTGSTFREDCLLSDHPCFGRCLGGISGGKETQEWRDSSHTAIVGAGKFGSAKLPMATATYSGKPSFSQ
jgi:hypothetical protein